MSIQSPYMTAAEACEYLRRKDLKAFYEAIVLEHIPHRRDGRRFLFRASELDAWLEEQGSRKAGEPTDRRGLSMARVVR